MQYKNKSVVLLVINIISPNIPFTYVLLKDFDFHNNNMLLPSDTNE